MPVGWDGGRKGSRRAGSGEVCVCVCVCVRRRSSDEGKGGGCSSQTVAKGKRAGKVGVQSCVPCSCEAVRGPADLQCAAIQKSRMRRVDLARTAVVEPAYRILLSPPLRKRISWTRRTATRALFSTHSAACVLANMYRSEPTHALFSNIRRQPAFPPVTRSRPSPRANASSGRHVPHLFG